MTPKRDPDLDAVEQAAIEFVRRKNYELSIAALVAQIPDKSNLKPEALEIYDRRKHELEPDLTQMVKDLRSKRVGPAWSGYQGLT